MITTKELLTSKQKYNLILISVDTLRADHMGVYGYKRNTSPKIDAWAKDATVFNRAYTIFPLTFQSFYTLFTGRNEAIVNPKLGYSYSVSEATEALSPTLPQILKQNGFITTAFVTNPVIDGLATNTFRAGFDNFKFYDQSHLSESINPGNAKDYFYNIFIHDNENSKQVTANSIEWINKNTDKKFFIWLHYSTPHLPYNPPQNYACELDKKFCDETEYQNALTVIPHRCTDTEKGSLKEDQVEDLKVLYDAEIISIDEEIGKVLKAIKDNNLDKESVVVFYADHGEGFDHNIFDHGFSLYESNIHIPFIIKVPGSQEKSIDTLIDNSDILPTLLDILGIKYAKNDYSGKSFIQSGKYINEDKEVFFMTPKDWTNKFGVIYGENKYIYSAGDKCLNNRTNEESYNLILDKNEERNNSKTQIYSELKNRLSEFFKTQEPPQKEIDQLKSLGY